jgi:hypothetical protein
MGFFYMSRKILSISFLFLILVISGCSPKKSGVQDQIMATSIKDNFPSILVDDDHLQIQGYPQKFYDISSGSGLIVDTTGYLFRIPDILKVDQPNMIQLIAGNSQLYSYKVQAKANKYLLSGDTLTPSGNAKPFDKFIAGQQIAIAIGYQDEKSQFFVIWVGMVNIH